MGSIQDFLKIQFGGLVVTVQESLYKLKTYVQNLAGWQRVLLVIFFILLIPGYFAVRYGTELYLGNTYARESLAAHPSFADPEKLQQTKPVVIQNANGTYSAYSIITNSNLDLALESVNYTFTFTNSAGEEVANSSGKTYILPNQKKWLVVPRVQAIEAISGAKLSIESPAWQKRLSLPDLELKMSEPYVYEQVEPLATITEGTIVNNSPYQLKQASLVLVLYDVNNKAVAVTTREEYSLDPYERRAYKIQWPGVYRSIVSRVGLEAYTNSLDPENISVQSDNSINNLVDPN